jgi:hypothetical protein
MEPKLLGSISKCTALALCTPDGERIVAAGGSGPGSVRVVSGSEPVSALSLCWLRVAVTNPAVANVVPSYQRNSWSQQLCVLYMRGK